MADAVVRYLVRVDKEGNGAQVAAAELVALGQAATGVNASLANMNSAAQTGTAGTGQSFSKLQQQTSVMQSTFKALDGTLRVIGFSTFPQITLAVTTAVDGMRALTNAARIAAAESARAAAAGMGGNVLGGIASGAGGSAAGSALSGVAGGAVAGGSLRAGFGALARTAGPWAVIAAGAYKSGQYVSELIGYNNDLDKLEESLKNVEDSARQTADALLKLAETRIASGDLNLSEASSAAIDKLILQQDFRGARAAIDANTRPSFFMTESEKVAAMRERADVLDRDIRYKDALDRPFYKRTDTAAGRQDAIDRVNDRTKQTRDQFDQFKNEGLMSSDQYKQVFRESEIERRNSITEIKQQMTEIEQLSQRAVGQFASGFSQAFVDFASGSKSAKEAFGDFARSFLSSIAQMILEQMILNAISGIMGGGKKAASGGTFPSKAASGGMFPRMMAAGGMAGVHSVSAETYFPRFNVVAGEAGREMLTVLARPRMMEIGGMQAVVGSAQGNKLAITNADELASRGGGAGGTIVVQIQGTPDYEARVIQNSVRGAVVQVANDMRQDTPIARGVKNLTA